MPVRQKSNAVLGIAMAALGVLMMPAAAVGQQAPDTTYEPPLGASEFASGTGPTVVIDAAHLNFHTADGSYRAFATLLSRAGYEVRSNDRAFTPAVLRDADVLVVANAMHAQSRDDWAPLPSLSAFTSEEIAALEAWVREGGSLLLIADHMPLAGHAEALAAAFGVRFLNGFALHAKTRSGRITFRRSDGSLPASAIADGRRDEERVDAVTAFTGQAFRLDPQLEAQPLLVLPEDYEVLLPTVAWEFAESTPRIPAAHLLQGAAIRHGRGRVAVFGEAAMFGAQLAGPKQTPVGMNAPDADRNYRFALNLMLWLCGRL